MFKIYRSPKQIKFGPGEYVTDEDGKVVIFYNEQDAKNYCDDELLFSSSYFDYYILEE